MKVLFLFLLPLMFNSYAADELDFNGDLYVLDSAMSAALAVYDNGGTGASESASMVAYIPYRSSAGVDERNYSYYSEIPYVHEDDIFNNSNGGGLGKKPCIRLSVTSRQTDNSYTYFHFMVQVDGRDYEAATLSTTSCNDAYTTTTKTLNLTNGSTTTFYVSWEQLASVSEGGTLDTTDWDGDDESNTIHSYLFLGTSAHGDVDEDDLDQGEYNGGLYLEMKFSSQQPSQTPTLNSLAKGDTQLTLSYNANSTLENTYLDMIFISANDAVSGGVTWKAFLTSPNGEILRNSGAPVSGEYKITSLTNDRRYYITAVARDVFYFVTELPATLENTPQELKAFIQEKSCYLLSAGFKDNHPVLEFFRTFRDQVLSHSTWGRSFISFYYKTAPHYAPMVADSEWISGVVKVFAYALYFIFNYFLLALIPLVALSLKWKQGLKNKKRQLSQRRS